MSTQLPITTFFGSRKRRATDALERNAKLQKGDPSLLKVTAIDTNVDQLKDAIIKTVTSTEQNAPKKVVEQTTPRKNSCDIRSYITSKSTFRPECTSSKTPIKFIRTERKEDANETTPVKPVGSIMKAQVNGRPNFSVKKSIRFEDETTNTAEKPISKTPSLGPEVETDDIIEAANALVEKIKNKSKTLSDVGKTNVAKKQEVMTAEQLRKKLARSAKLSELKSSLSKLGQQASELIKLEKKKEIDQPKMIKFDSIEIDVPRSPHKGALASPVKSPAKPAYERFAHLIHRTVPATTAASLPLPLGYQRLLDLFTATDTVCSMMLNRGELITYRKLKPAVQELTRKNITERHLAQMATVFPEAFDFRQEKLRNFGSTSKVDRYELVVTPRVDGGQTGSPPSETSNLVVYAERKKMTPKMMQLRRDAFQRALLERTLDKHEEFLAGLDPPLNVVRTQLTRWHPNFPVDLVPDVPPASLPEPPTTSQPPKSARDVLERAKQLLSANNRMRNALEAASRSVEEQSAQTKMLDKTVATDEKLMENKTELSPETIAAVDKRVAAHDPLKGISKSLLDRIRAKQAAKALETMKKSPADEQELQLISQLPDIARMVRSLYVDGQKGVLPWETVLEKVTFSSKRTITKADVEKLLRRLIKEVPDWLSVFHIKSMEYLKLDRLAPFAPIMDLLNKMVDDRRRALS